MKYYKKYRSCQVCGNSFSNPFRTNYESVCDKCILGIHTEEGKEQLTCRKCGKLFKGNPNSIFTELDYKVDIHYLVLPFTCVNCGEKGRALVKLPE